MGDIADMMLEGLLCGQCGEYIDDDGADGYPRSCGGCRGEEKSAPKPRTKAELDAHSVRVNKQKTPARTLHNREKRRRKKANKRRRLEEAAAAKAAASDGPTDVLR